MQYNYRLIETYLTLKLNHLFNTLKDFNCIIEKKIQELKYPEVLFNVLPAGVFFPAYKLEGNRQWALW